MKINRTSPAPAADNQAGDVSRRGMLLGLGAAAAGAAAGTALLGGTSHAASAVPRIGGGHVEAVSAPLAGLTYFSIDAQQMWPSVAADRVYQDLTGSPSKARPKKARGMASGNAPRASRKAATRRRTMPPAMRMPAASFCGFAVASSRAPKTRMRRAARPARKAGIV